MNQYGSESTRERDEGRYSGERGEGRERSER